MDLHDHELDSLISLALQPAPVMAQQKQLAWEKLHAKLAEPALLPATAETPTRTIRLWRAVQIGWDMLRSFALEEARYESARQERYAYRYYSFALDPASFSLEVMGPLRVSKLGQVC
ncbi:MAG: hypothetical protein HZC41_03755 [Chloroflexi bacterium]|nr:hypothetical protein [Chloroflexota bacterium]